MGIRFSDLTDEEKSLVTNGCGNKKGVIRAPGFIFLASCNHHDFNYKIGYREKDRRRADKQFHEAMIEDTKRYKGLKRKWYEFCAGAYYVSVRAGGWAFFNYSDHRLTRAELDVMIKEARDKRDGKS
jgi:hypothetical protein